MVLVISFKSYAYSNEDKINLKQRFNTKYGIQLNDTLAGNLLTYWETNSNTYTQMWVQYNSTRGYAWVFGTYDHEQSGNIYYQGVKFAWTNNPTSETNLPASSGGGLSSIPNDSLSLGTWDSFHTIPIDWENPFYSANIPAPVFEVYNAELNSVPIVDVPLSFDFQFVPSNTYVEVWADYTVPTKLNVVPQPNNGAQYRVLDYNVVSVNVLDKELLYESEAINSSYMHVILRDGWDNVLENLPITDVEFITQAGTQAWLDNRIAEYEDLRKTNTLFGSAIKIKMRYFSIVNDNQFVVGPWRIWDSKNPEMFTNELPTNYQVYLPANGTSGTNSDTSPNADIPIGSGRPTGTYYDPSVNITVTQNVPNYPDYPTIVSYNKDNLLVDTMNWADNLSSFFGEFGGFLTDSFVFIPGWIWAIIGFGFSLSIVVMFLKIL